MSPEDMQRYRAIWPIPFTLFFVWVATTFGWFTRIVWDRLGHGWAYGMAIAGFVLLVAALEWRTRRLVRRAEEHGEVCR